MKTHRSLGLSVLALLEVGILAGSAGIARANVPPVANAGLPRYAAQDPIRLDGSGSYDPDHSGSLTYAWRQISGPPVVITDANTAAPLISGPTRQTGGRGQTISTGFVQTDAIQECQFELVVSDGQQASSPDTVKVIIVPDFGATTLQQANPPFDPNKPTIFYLGGGDCVNGANASTYDTWSSAAWNEKANIVNFPAGYAPDSLSYETWRTYCHLGDMMIVFLSKAAPNYAQRIQTMGWSTGGQPALDAGIRLNRIYQDSRYVVSHVTLLECPCRWEYQSLAVDAAANTLFLTSAVDGEPCWLDHYWGDTFRLQAVPDDVLGVYLEGATHPGVPAWYMASLTSSAACQFNHGVVAGAYWSVIGPGKNLQLTQQGVGHYFAWTPEQNMVLFSEGAYPGRLPEPVALGAWVSKSDVSGASDGVVLTCDESENAVGYQLLFGSDPHRLVDYKIISDTPGPPTGIVSDLPSGQTWWTIRVRDQYGSTIYADPIPLDLTRLPPMGVQNARTGKRYALIGHAIRDADPGDDIVLEPGAYEENIDLASKTLTVSSLDPNDPAVVAGTIISGPSDGPTVTFSGPDRAGGVLAGLTIQSGTVGISCRGAVPTIRNCVVQSPNGTAVEFWWGCKPNLVGCTILGEVKEGGDPGLTAYWKLDEASGAVAADSVGTSNGTLMGDPVWQPAGGKIGGALQLDGQDDCVTAGFVLDPSRDPFSVFAWVKGGAPDQVIVSQDQGANWLRADEATGALRTDLRQPAAVGRNGQPAGPPLISSAVITDGNWHRVGFVWDGGQRILYVDEVEVARDTAAGLEPATGGLHLGTDSKLTSGTFWSGLVDDVRIYDRAVAP